MTDQDDIDKCLKKCCLIKCPRINKLFTYINDNSPFKWPTGINFNGKTSFTNYCSGCSYILFGIIFAIAVYFQFKQIGDPSYVRTRYIS